MKPARLFPLLLASVLLLYAVFFGARLVRYAGHLSAFIGFGCYTAEVCWARENRALLPDETLVFRTGGYDGQFYYYMSAAFARGATPVVDAPALRTSRIGYSLLAMPAALIGPRTLVWWLLLLPLVVHLYAVFSLYRFYQAIKPGDALIVPLIGVALFALNPLSLYANGLALADGLALSLGLLALMGYWRTLGARGKDGLQPIVFMLYVPAFVAAVLACLTKETMLALPLGVGTAALLRRDWRSSGFWFGVLLPVFLYWSWIGFSPGLAADRGGWPLAGYFEFLGSPDLGGGRAFLAVLFPAFIVVGSGLAWQAYKDEFDFKRPDPLSLAGVLAVATLLISFATADEYWANFANISRFFIPGLLPLALLPVLLGRDEKAGWSYVLAALVLFLVLFALALLYAELRAEPLPYDIYSAAAL